MLHVLVISRGFHHQGGVVNFVRIMINNFTSAIQPVHFEISGGDNRNIIKKVRHIISDNRRLSKTIASNHFDCIHFNPSLNAKSFYRDAFFIHNSLKTTSRLIIYFHGWNTDFAEKLLRNKHLKLLFNSSYAKADKILVLASDFKNTLIKLGIPQEKIKVTTTMFEADHIPANKQNKKNINILFLSRLVKEKGILELIDAFSHIVKEYPDIKLIVAGDGPDKNKAEDLVQKYHLDSDVEFTGYIKEEDKLNVLKKATIFVLPTYHGEGCPVSILEAMASGLAIITTSVGGLSDIIENNKNGIIIPTPRSEEIYNALKILLNDSDFSTYLASNAREKAWSRYESSIVTRYIENIYQEACRSS